MKFSVVFHQARLFGMEIEADSEEEALAIANGVDVVEKTLAQHPDECPEIKFLESGWTPMIIDAGNDLHFYSAAERNLASTMSGDAALRDAVKKMTSEGMPLDEELWQAVIDYNSNHAVLKTLSND
jgi:hypothetical protein